MAASLGPDTTGPSAPAWVRGGRPRKFELHDRDSVYGAAFQRRAAKQLLSRIEPFQGMRILGVHNHDLAQNFGKCDRTESC